MNQVDWECSVGVVVSVNTEAFRFLGKGFQTVPSNVSRC